MKQLRILFTTALLAGASLSGAQATAIHKWVDARGVTHYSDKPPVATTIQTTQLDIDTGRDSTADATLKPDHYYSIANQWQRMNQEGLQRRQFELQRAAISAATEARREPAAEQTEVESKRYVAVYPKRWHRKRGHRHGHHGPGPQQHTRPSGFPTVVKQPG